VVEDFQMSQTALRQDLAKRLRRKDVPDPVWDHLVDDGYIDAVLTGGTEQFGDLEEEAKRLLRFYRKLATWERRQEVTEKPQYIAPDPGEYVTQRALALDDALALKASRTKEVRAFRDRVLGGAPLTLPLAHQLLASSAARIWRASEFERRGIPIVGHRGVEVANREQFENGVFRQEIDLKVTWDDEVLETTVSRSWPATVFLHDPVLQCVDEHGEALQEEIWGFSVKDRLRETSVWLGRTYGFDVAQATWFVLTGAAPHRAPLEVGITRRYFPTHTDGRVTFSIDPWVPADVVLRAYRDVQRHLLGRENRPLSLRNLGVFRSVLEDARKAERTNPGKQPPAPARSMSRWNREHPEEAYTQEWQFNRDVNRAEQAVLFPNYRRRGADKEEDA
jgi:hypothetical protein